MIFQLIYTCALRENIAPDDLEKIAINSRLKNKERAITGILLFKEGSALQVLEGDKQVVKDLYKHIADDPRVTNPLILIERMSSEREFSNWSMGYKNANNYADVFELTPDSLADNFPQRPSPEIETISRTFARVNGLA